MKSQAGQNVEYSEKLNEVYIIVLHKMLLFLCCIYALFPVFKKSLEAKLSRVFPFTIRQHALG